MLSRDESTGPILVPSSGFDPVYYTATAATDGTVPAISARSTMDSPVQRALALRKAALFSTLPTSELLPVANLCTEVALDSGDVLFHEGDLGDAMYVVVRGEVSVERSGSIMTTLGPSESVGEIAVLDWNPRDATVVAEGPTVLVRLDRHDLLDLLVDHPILAENMAAMLAARIRAVEPSVECTEPSSSP